MENILTHADFKVNKNAFNYSVCGKYLAYAVQNKVVVFDTEKDIKLTEIGCVDIIDHVEWSHDSDYILCAMYDRSTVQVFSLIESNWHCKIVEGSLGLRAVQWSPSGYHILTMADYNVRITIWALNGQPSRFIDNPIMKKGDPLSFSPGGEHLAVLLKESEDCHINLFSTTTWEVDFVIKYSNETISPSILLWSPLGLNLAVWETVNLCKCLLEIYSLKSKSRVKKFEKSKAAGMISVRTAIWTTSSQFLLIGCSDGFIYILNSITWGTVSGFEHAQVISSKEAIVYQEIIQNDDITKFEIQLDRPITFTSTPLSLNPLRLPGIGKIVCSWDGRYIASQLDVMPAVVWIWSIAHFRLIAVITFKRMITDFQWDTTQNQLLVCTNHNLITIYQLKKIDKTKIDLIRVTKSKNVAIRRGIWRPPSDSQKPYLCLFSQSKMYVHNEFIGVN